MMKEKGWEKRLGADREGMMWKTKFLADRGTRARANAKKKKCFLS